MCAEHSARAKSVSVTETPTFTPDSFGLPAASICSKNANARYRFQSDRVLEPTNRSGDNSMMFVPGIPNGFPATEARSDAYKPLPSPPAHHGRLNSASQSRAKVRKQPLTDRSNIQKRYRTLKKSHSVEKMQREKGKGRLDANENQYDAPDPKLTALPRPPSAIKLPNLFRATQSRDSGPETGSVTSDDDHNSTKTNDTAHSVQQHKGMEGRDTQKHRAVLDKFKEAITDRWPSMTSSGRRRQKRHTVLLGDAAKAANGIGVLVEVQEDVKRRMAEEQNLGSPKLQRMLDSPRKGTTPGSPGWQQYIPSGLDDLRSLATSARDIAGLESVETDDPFCDRLEATFSTIPSDFLDFDFGLTGTHGAAVSSKKQTEEIMDLVDLGSQSATEDQSSGVSGIGIYGLDQEVTHEKELDPLASYSIKMSGLYQHPHVMAFASPLQNQIVATARSHLYTSALDRRRRNGVQLAQSPLKKVHTLSDASGQYEYVPDLAMLPDGTRFIDITDSASRALSDDVLNYDVDMSMSHSKHTSDASKRSIEKAGLTVDSLPTKKSKMQILASNSEHFISLANDSSEDRPSATDDQARHDNDRNSISNKSAELDCAMTETHSLADEPIIETAKAIKQPSASERRLSNVSRGHMVSLRGGSQSMRSYGSEPNIKVEEEDELQLPDPRFKFKST